MKSSRNIVISALMATIMLISKYTLDALPNIELLSLFVIIFTLEMPKLALPAIYGYVFVYGLFNGFGIWWFSQLYIWLVLYFAVKLFKTVNNVLFWAVLSGLFGLSYGALYALSYIVTSGFYAGIAWWIAGIPFDILHCVGNFFIALILFVPLRKIVKKANELTI